jgi:hypothetical protein
LRIRRSCGGGEVSEEEGAADWCGARDNKTNLTKVLLPTLLTLPFSMKIPEHNISETILSTSISLHFFLCNYLIFEILFPLL